MGAEEPATDTHFLAWGQAVYNVHGVGPAVPGGLAFLFAISDSKRTWLAWYLFAKNGVSDVLLLKEQDQGGAEHDVIAQKAPFPSHFTTHRPMRVDELAGPYMYSRGGSSAIGSRALVFTGGTTPPDSVMGIQLSVKPGVVGDDIFHSRVPIVHVHLYFRSAHPEKVPTTDGYLNFKLVEPFKYPVPHLNRLKRLRTFEHNIMHDH